MESVHLKVLIVIQTSQFFIGNEFVSTFYNFRETTFHFHNKKKQLKSIEKALLLDAWCPLPLLQMSAFNIQKGITNFIPRPENKKIQSRACIAFHLA